MSFLRKRSGSQSSAPKIDQDHSVGKSDRDEPNNLERRYSTVSSHTDAIDFELQDSCVVRNFPKHKSSHLRFLAWVAYTRKYTVSAITNEERRTCPLLWCRDVFEDQEAMLKHVWECEHLSKGLYWCFHCQRPERVGKFQCKRCEGMPSRTDRLATVAKKIFSRLGTKPHKPEHSNPSSPRRRLTGTSLCNIAEAVQPSQQGNDSNIVDFEQEDLPPPWDHSYIHDTAELSGNQILEMDNTGLVSEMDTSWNFQQEQVDTKAPKEEISQIFPDIYSSIDLEPEPTFSKAEAPWSPSSFDVQRTAPKSPARSIPTLAPLNTRDIYQQPSLRQQNGASNWSDEPMSATVVSPLSPTERFFSGMMGADISDTEISPTDSEATCNSFDSGYSSATVKTSLSFASVDYERVLDGLETRERLDGPAFSVSADKFVDKAAALDPLADKVLSNASMSPHRSASNSSTHSAGRCTALVKTKDISPHWSDAKTLVESFVEVLNEHLKHSRRALNQLPSSSVIRELLAMSTASIISIGLDVLRGLLEKRKPTAIISSFAFTHVAYALAIVVDHDKAKVEMEDWFQDSLAWIEGIASERQRQAYRQIAQAIWQPSGLPGINDILDLAGSVTGKERESQSGNRLLKACTHFLDIQQSFSYDKIPAICKNATTGEVHITYTQASFYRTTKSRIIDELIKKVSIEAFIEDVVDVELQLQQGFIKDLRQLEVSLICIGKPASQSPTIYEKFLNHITCLTDSLYAEGESDRSRSEYHIDEIEVTKSLIPEELPSEEDGNDLEHMAHDPTPSLDLSECNRAIDGSVEGFYKEADEILGKNLFIPLLSRSLFLAGSETSFESCLEPTEASYHGLHPLSYSQPQLKIPKSPITTASTPATSKPTTKAKSTHLAVPDLFGPSTSRSPSHVSSPFSSAPNPSSKTLFKSPTGQQTASALRCHCGYTPRGEEKWKASNLARHKRIQHAADLKIYSCRFRGCESTVTRSDNLRSHQRDTRHFDERFLDDGESEEEGLYDREDEIVVFGFRDGQNVRLRRVDRGSESEGKRGSNMDSGVASESSQRPTKRRRTGQKKGKMIGD